MSSETFWTLLSDLPHWEFELFLMFLFDVVIGLILYPCFTRFVLHHKSDDSKTAELERQVAELRKHLGLSEKKE